MLKKTIYGGKIPLDFVWTIKIAKSDGSMKMVKVAHTGELTDKDLDDVDELIKKYADTPVLEEMKMRPDTFLWARARAIDADQANENGDSFSEEELLKEVDAGNKGKIPTYKTFEGVPIYTNHKNDDIEQAKGKVVHAEWDKNEKCVYCTFYIDAEAYPQLARGIQEGYIKDVSMGASVDHSRCSICDNKAVKESEFCSHIKQFKGRKFSGVVDKGPNKGKRVTDEPVFEKNYGVKFIELSCVSDGAYENCEIELTLPHEKMIKSMTESIKKESKNVNENIKLCLERDEILESDETRELFVAVANLTDKIVKVAEREETKFLKSSQIFPESPRDIADPASQVNQLAGPGQQEQVVPMADPAAALAPPVPDGTAPSTGEGVGINTLDALKGVIQHINTVIVTLLNTRGINLEHVRDLSKSVADIQDTIEDMIDSGSIDISGSVPITPGQSPQMGAPVQTPPTGNPEYATPPEGVGMQVGASTEQKIIKLAKLKEKLEKTCKYICNTHPNKEESGIMSEFRKLAATLREQKSAEKTETYEQEIGGYKISVASNGDIKASYRGMQVDWKPEISDDLIDRIDEGQIANVTSELLNQFVVSYSDNRRIQRVASVDAETPAEGTERRFQSKDATWPVGRLGNPGYPEENYVENARKGLNSNRENDLAEVRQGVDPRVKEHQLGDRSVADGHLGRGEVDPRVKEHQLEDVREGVDVQVEENRLSPRRARGDAAKIVESVNAALAKSVVEAMVSPEEVVSSAIKLASSGDDLADVISEYSAKEHKDAREVLRKRSRFYGRKVVLSENTNLDSYLIGNLSDVASQEVLPLDLVHGLKELQAQNQEKYASLIGQMAKDEIDRTGNSSSYIESFEPDLVKQSEIRKQFLKAMASQDSGESQVSKESVKAVITALAKTLIEKQASDEEMTGLLNSFDRNEVYSEIELAKDKELVNQRKITNSRKNYWLGKKANIELNSEDISQRLINMIADNISDNNVSTRSAVDTIDLLKDKPEATKKAINMAVDKLLKTSASVTDRSEREFTVQFDLSEAGCDKNDPEVESRIREYVVRLFGDRGYELSDPESLSFTSLDINDNGHVCGTIKSSVVRTFSANEARESAPVAIGVVANSVLSDKVIQARKDEREALVKAAQAMGAGGMGEGLAGNPGADPAAAATGADPGIAAITGGGEPGASDEMGDEKSPEESLPTPGQIAPPGSICPACGSTDVDLAEGHGKCNDCATEFEVTMQIQIVNPEGFSEGTNLGEEEPMEMGEEIPGEEVNPLEQPGAGAAAGTAAVGGQGAPMPTGMPGTPMARSIFNRVVTASSDVPLIARLSWVDDPDVFLRTAYTHRGEIEKSGTQAAGHVCPACGEIERVVRVASVDKTNVYCDSCSTISVVKLAKTSDGKIRNDITWCI